MTAWQWWLVASFVLLILEVGVPGSFFMVSLAVGALVAAAAAALAPDSSWVAWLTFSVASILAVAASRKIVHRLDRAPTIPMNVDALIGKEAVVIQRIEASAVGLVRIGTEEWRAESDRSIEEGERVTVRAVRGTRLLVQ